MMLSSLSARTDNEVPVIALLVARSF